MNDRIETAQKLEMISSSFWLTDAFQVHAFVCQNRHSIDTAICQRALCVCNIRRMKNKSYLMKVL